jgi:hypothetical protein
MALALDFLLFGNGYGLKSPYFDDLFFWLVDTMPAGRKAGRGALYNWIGGLGAQLRNRQWRMPQPGERRRLAGHEFVVFNASRTLLRVDVSWALVGLPKGLDEAHAVIRQLEADLHRCDPLRD